MPEAVGLPFDERPARARPLSVSDLTLALRRLIDERFGAVLVEGELSNCRQWSSGHLYFTLKDDRAQVRAVMFRTAVRSLTFRPEDGLRVVVRGRLSVYDAKGEYQIVCDTLEPQGLGALQAAFEQLKRRLQQDGLFDPARKRPLPLWPRRIGVVTSLDGAALRDILRVLTTRHPTARVVIRAARVQGEGAAEDLMRALRAIVRVPGLDVVLVGRGGGSIEDLWAFNDERLARAIAECPVPVISCVGHEVDFTIADFVADVRAATPSNAAEIVVERADHVVARIDRARHRLRACMSVALSRRLQRAERLRGRLEQWPTRVVMAERDGRQLALRLRHAVHNRIARQTQRFTVLSRRLERCDARRAIAELRTRLAVADGRLRGAIGHRRLAAGARVATVTAQLDALSPLAVLARGYAVCWNDARTAIIRTTRGVTPGDRVRVTLAEGELACRVEDAPPHTEP
ncbi:MAG: exodeoxyribonuclease VII large subunit [Acidobacteria bacterium]|nr:exodeoxyribonuclease VII large subunit [Acidobacteriota bacterium]